MRRNCKPKLPVFKERHSPEDELNLTPGQARILSLVFSGLTVKEMAQKLNLSVSAIKHHLSAIYRKAGMEGGNWKKSMQLLNKFGRFEISVKWIPKERPKA